MTVQFGGPIGSFLDNVQQRDVPVVVAGLCDYMANGPVADPAQLDQHVRMQLMRAIQQVVAQKMATQEISFRHLGMGQLGAVMPEIIAASGLEQGGIRIGNLQMSFGIDGHPPQGLPGAQPMAQEPQHNLAAGTFDMGGGQQLQVKINGRTPENFLKDKASSMIWGWIIGAIIVGVMVLTAIGFGIYIYIAAKDTTGGAAAGRTAAAAKWDGKSTFECGGNDAVMLTGITASAGVKAAGNCVLTMTGVNITAPVGIEASGNAKVTMTGGSVTASSNSVVAGLNAHVDFVGTKVTGKAKTSQNAKVTGAP